MAINYTYPLKGSPVTADEFLIIDSVDNSTKKVTASSVLSLTTIPATTWGTITGTLSTQTDLQAALNLKANLAGATFTGAITSPDFIGDLNGAVRFEAVNKSGGTLLKGDVVAITGNTGSVTEVSKADADNAALRPAFGLVFANSNNNEAVEVVTFGNLTGLNTSAFANESTLYVSTLPGELTATPPTGEAASLQNIGKVIRSNQNNGIIKVGGAGRANATPNLNSAKIFLGNSSNQSVATAVTGEVTISNTGVTEVTGIDGNVSIQGYSPIVTKNDATFSISTDEAGKTILFTNGGTVAINITDNSEYPVGSEVQIVNFKASGSIEVAAGGGTTLTGGTEITQAYGSGILKKAGTNSWVFFGQVA